MKREIIFAVYEMNATDRTRGPVKYFKYRRDARWYAEGRGAYAHVESIRCHGSINQGDDAYVLLKSDIPFDYLSVTNRGAVAAYALSERKDAYSAAGPLVDNDDYHFVDLGVSRVHIY